jgi:hypothetical protein
MTESAGRRRLGKMENSALALFLFYDVRFLPGWVDAKVLNGVHFMTDVSNYAISVKPLCHRLTHSVGIGMMRTRYEC